jgi:hypothetical protein
VPVRYSVLGLSGYRPKLKRILGRTARHSTPTLQRPNSSGCTVRSNRRGLQKTTKLIEVGD